MVGMNALQERKERGNPRGVYRLPKQSADTDK